jgi:hypothetical protein
MKSARHHQHPSRVTCSVHVTPSLQLGVLQLSLAEAFSLFLTSLRIVLESVSCIVEIWWPHTIAPIREACVTHATLTPSSIVASPEPQTTAEMWDLFERYNVATRGRNDIPPQFLKNAIWRDHQGRLGYYAESTLSPRAIVPVEFNEPHLCWVELHWRAHKDQWQAF